MDLRKLSINQIRIFDSHSSLDVPVVRQATTYGFALIGGTAVEHLANFYNVSKRRSRSINDLDFITPHNNPHKTNFINFLESKRFMCSDFKDSDYLIPLENKEEGIDVDLLFTYDSQLESYLETVGGFLTVSPIYLFLTKIQRLSLDTVKKQTDIQDINTLYDVIVARDEIEELQDLLSENGFDSLEDEINLWLSETD